MGLGKPDSIPILSASARVSFVVLYVFKEIFHMEDNVKAEFICTSQTF